MDFKQKLLITFLVFIIFGIPSWAGAHQPVLEPPVSESSLSLGFYTKAIKLSDPTKQSLANYGTISIPGEVDLYVFVPEQEASIPVELLVPVRPVNKNFKPEVVIFSKSLDSGEEVFGTFQGLSIPDGFKKIELSNDHGEGYFYEPFSQERYWRGTEATINLKSGQNYFLAVYDPANQTGDYSLGIGTVENFQDTSFVGLLQNIVAIKLNLLGNNQVPWIDFIGLFLMVAGLVLGLGAVTVIDLHGFLGRKSEYWTESTIRAHKVTKPLIWIGMVVWIIGGVITYRESWLTGVALFQLPLTILLILNGFFLSFYVSPKLLAQEKAGEISKLLPQSLQNKIAVSFIISIFGWWTNLFLLVWYIVLMR